MLSEHQQTEYIFSLLEPNPTKNVFKVDTESAESYIYVDNTSKTLFKVSKNDDSKTNLLRSYYIGKELNKLRSIVPNFVLTKQVHDQSRLAVSYEYIQGETLEMCINSLTFPQFLNIFIQILFALELAQRHCMFCHYDLHLDNIIMKPIESPHTYTIILDDDKYEITGNAYIPVIIDFGLASSIIQDKVFGTRSYDYCGIMNYPIQGSDMYKLLFHSYAASTGTLQRQIGSLFHFYGAYDPYKILVSSQTELVEISKEYLKQVSTSRIAAYTPLEYIMWIMSNSDYSKLLSVNKMKRYIYYYPTVVKSGYVESTNSYIMNKYIEKLTSSRECTHEDECILLDQQLLVGYKRLEIPNEIAVKDQANTVLNLTIKDTLEPKYKYIQQADRFIRKMTPYLQYLYIIRELNLESVYKCFVDEFTVSLQYEGYQKLCFIVEKTNRWLKTLSILKHCYL